jgi:hypothetical protein
MTSDLVMDLATKIDTDANPNTGGAMDRGAKLLAERLGEIDWIDREMEERTNAIMLKNIAKAELKEESKNTVETKEENRIKYLEIYNDEIINNNNI